MQNKLLGFEEKSGKFDKAVSLLIVDDDSRARDSLKQLLGRRWRNISEAVDGEEAIERIKTREFHLIVLDLNMPRKSGDQVLAFIRDRKIHTPVIVISGENSINKVTEAMRLGAYDIFRKPYNIDELEHAIGNALDKLRVDEEKRIMQHRLQHSERLHRYMIANSPDLIYILNLDGKFTFVNDSVTRLLGYRKKELIGKHYGDFIYDADRLKAEYVFNERRRENRSRRNVELRLKCNPARGERNFEIDVCPIELNSMGIYAVNSRDGKTLGSYQGTYGVARDITSRKQAEKLVTYQAYHDLLTGLPNRAMLHDRLELAINQASRTDATLIVMFVDLDRFKLINDSFGHAVGDQMLTSVAARLKAEIRTGDTLARLGGDEFVLLLPQPTSREQAERVAVKLIESMQQPFRLNERDVYVNVSIGIAVYPDDAADINALMRNADTAMYEVKTSGRNGYLFFDREIEHAASEKISIESGLRQAIKKDEFEMLYQPQFDTRYGRIVGVEALLRWNHPVLGQCSPNYFIEQAEESHLIEQISEWVLERVAVDLFSDKGFLDSGIRVGVNLSPTDINMKEFPENLVTYIEDLHIDPRRLEIEITENMFMGDLKACVYKLQVLANKGITIAIDDFGTGFSSLNYLRELPVHTIKIDHSFVSEIEHSKKGAGLVAAIIGMARGLGIDLIAEGVENNTQLTYLRGLGCEVVQGYLYSRPLTVDDFLQRVAAQDKVDSSGRTAS